MSIPFSSTGQSYVQRPRDQDALPGHVDAYRAYRECGFIIKQDISGKLTEPLRFEVRVDAGFHFNQTSVDIAGDSAEVRLKLRATHSSPHLGDQTCMPRKELLVVPKAQFERFGLIPHGLQIAEGLWWTGGRG